MMDFPTPLIAGTTPEVSTIEAGEGDPIRPARRSTSTFVVEYGDGRARIPAATRGQRRGGVEGNSLSEALECAHVGDRLALVTHRTEASATDSAPERSRASTPSRRS